MVKLDALKAYLEEMGYACDYDVPMKGYTSFKIGGPAPLLVKATDLTQMSGILAKCHQLELRPIIVGKGSNLLIRDAGIDMPVLQIGEQFADMQLVGDTSIYCRAGATLTRLCRFAMENALTGLEFAFGIPGSVGGAIYMNAGAYGGEMKDVVVSATHLNPDGTEGSFPAGELDFSYRHSAYTDTGLVITGATFQLRRGDREEIRRLMDETMQKRVDKQPLEYPSAGSTFKRPVGNYASALIDCCGLKGKRVGGAMVSEKHAGFVINYDDATCEDVLGLIAQIQDTVREQTGFELECEVKLLP